MELAEKYKKLKESGKLNKYISKKRKRNAAKERKYLPKKRDSMWAGTSQEQPLTPLVAMSLLVNLL